MLTTPIRCASPPARLVAAVLRVAGGRALAAKRAIRLSARRLSARVPFDAGPDKQVNGSSRFLAGLQLKTIGATSRAIGPTVSMFTATLLAQLDEDVVDLGARRAGSVDDLIHLQHGRSTAISRSGGRFEHQSTAGLAQSSTGSFSSGGCRLTEATSMSPCCAAVGSARSKPDAVTKGGHDAVVVIASPFGAEPANADLRTAWSAGTAVGEERRVGESSRFTAASSLS